LIKLKLFRPFPIQEIIQSMQSLDAVAVVDRAISSGGLGGPVYEDVRSTLYDLKRRPIIMSVIAGIGGRDITVSDFESIGKHVIDTASKGVSNKPLFIQVRS
jgi:pyruvate ferredoxin oxidoreductase alpha subunit